MRVNNDILNSPESSVTLFNKGVTAQKFLANLKGIQKGAESFFETITSGNDNKVNSGYTITLNNLYQNKLGVDASTYQESDAFVNDIKGKFIKEWLAAKVEASDVSPRVQMMQAAWDLMDLSTTQTTSNINEEVDRAVMINTLVDYITNDPSLGMDMNMLTARADVAAKTGGKGSKLTSENLAYQRFLKDIGPEVINSQDAETNDDASLNVIVDMMHDPNFNPEVAANQLIEDGVDNVNPNTPEENVHDISTPGMG